MKKNNKRKILPSITTTFGSDWKAQLKEVKELRLKEIAIFPTCLKERERKKFYNLIEKTGIKSIPFCHLRSDMKIEELDYLINKFHTKVFSLHSLVEFPLLYDYSKYKNMIYIENVFSPLNEREIKNFGGISLDISHLENDRLLHKEKFKKDLKVIKKCSIGCNHISTIKKFILLKGKLKERGVRHTDHLLESFSDLDYLKKYSKNYFSDMIAIELENSIKEQLLAKKYIANILNKIINIKKYETPLEVFGIKFFRKKFYTKH